MIKKMTNWGLGILWVIYMILSFTLIIPFAYWVYTGNTWFMLLSEMEYKVLKRNKIIKK